MIRNRLLAFVAASIVICVPAFSQNKSRIGSAHAVNFGTGFGYATSPVAAFGGVFMDINASGSNLRTRVGFNIENVKLAVCGTAEVDVQYLLPLDEGLYFYPFAGFKAAYHDYALYGDKAVGFAPQAGLGLEYQFSSHFGVFVQGTYEYEVSNLESVVLGQAGVIFAFGQGRKKTVSAAPKAAKVPAPVTATEAQARAAAKAAEVEASIARTKAEVAARAAASNTPRSARSASSVKVVSPDSTYKVKFMTGTSFVNQDGRDMVDLLIAYLQAHPEKTIEIVGYADGGADTADGGMGLAQKRVTVLKSFFAVEGIDPSRVNVRTAASGENPSPSPEENSAAMVFIK